MITNTNTISDTMTNNEMITNTNTISDTITNNEIITNPNTIRRILSLQEQGNTFNNMIFPYLVGFNVAKNNSVHILLVSK